MDNKKLKISHCSHINSYIDYTTTPNVHSRKLQIVTLAPNGDEKIETWVKLFDFSDKGDAEAEKKIHQLNNDLKTQVRALAADRYVEFTTYLLSQNFERTANQTYHRFSDFLDYDTVMITGPYKDERAKLSLTELINSKHQTVHEFAKANGIAPRTLERYTSGRSDLGSAAASVVLALAKGLNMSMESLLVHLQDMEAVDYKDSLYLIIETDDYLFSNIETPKFGVYPGDPIGMEYEETWSSEYDMRLYQIRKSVEKYMSKNRQLYTASETMSFMVQYHDFMQGLKDNKQLWLDRNYGEDTYNMPFKAWIEEFLPDPRPRW